MSSLCRWSPILMALLLQCELPCFSDSEVVSENQADAVSAASTACRSLASHRSIPEAATIGQDQ
ncbi:hypothetical protein KC19_5G020300 [Ceratodon purpureus]|uniref:Uncharacterized protein n=1 Tax=Ceratodon purpureus TaxID=3225 RepID=A0A8T0HZ89_CERPU|nr:hypothetical protein KC19_5G020300 [Ceratodon purpureus]